MTGHELMYVYSCAGALRGLRIDVRGRGYLRTAAAFDGTPSRDEDFFSTISGIGDECHSLLFCPQSRVTQQ